MTKIDDSKNLHPCLSCGACCAYFRVSFYSLELASESFEVPREFVADAEKGESVMRGTDLPSSPRCVALEGQVGKDAHCSIYENRPSPCRKFESSYTHGVKEPRCDEARALHGMSPLKLRDYDLFRNSR